MYKLFYEILNTIRSHKDTDAQFSKLSPHIAIFAAGNLCDIGGVQQSYVDLLKSFDEFGGRSTLLNHYLSSDIDANSFLYEFPKKTEFIPISLKDLVDEQEKIRNKIIDINPDVILIVNSSRAALNIVLSLEDLNIPIIISERGGADFNLQYNWLSKKQRYVTHQACVRSHFLMESYSKALPKYLQDQIRIIPSLIHPSKIGYSKPSKPQSDQRMKLIYVGRLAFEKDVDILIDAFFSVHRELPDWDLIICGAGPDESSLKDQVIKHENKNDNELNLESSYNQRVKFLGALDAEQVMSLYLNGNMFVLPSRGEGCPLALREAMAHGLPVIGFQNASGVNAIINNELNGLLVEGEKREQKEANLAHAILRLAENHDMRDRLGQQGIKDIKQYSPEIVLKAWRKLIVEALEKKNNRKVKFEEKELIKLRKRLLNRDFARRALLPEESIPAEYASAYLICFGSCLFDAEWYGKEYPEVKFNGNDPLLHYLSKGHVLGFKPSMNFDAELYRSQIMGGDQEVCPLFHLYLNKENIENKSIFDEETQKNFRLETFNEPDLNVKTLEDIAKVVRWGEMPEDWFDWKRRISIEYWSQENSNWRTKYNLSTPNLSLRKKTEKLVSVVIPIYNKEEFIEDTINDFLNINGYDIEIILVNDGSTDKSGDIAEQYGKSHRNIHVIHQENKGLSEARNAGISAARANWIFFHDADDRIITEGFTALIDKAINSKALILGGVFNRVHMDGSEKVIQAFQRDELVTSFSENEVAAMQYCTNFSSCNKLFSRKSLETLREGFRPQLHMEDIEFWLRTMMLDIPFEQTSLVVSNYIDYKNTLSKQRSPERLEGVFRLYDYLTLSHSDSQLDRAVVDSAFLQGALNFFIRWCLNEYNSTRYHNQGKGNLFRIMRLLNEIPENSFQRFYVEKNRGPICALSLAVRMGDFECASKIVTPELSKEFWAFARENPKASLDEIISFSRKVTKTT